MIGASGLTGRPLRALAGLGLMLALWIGVRLPAMHREMQALALLAAPPVLMLAPTVVMLAPLGPMLVPPPMRAGAGVLRPPLSPPPPLLQALAVPADVPQPVASPVPSAPLPQAATKRAKTQTPSNLPERTPRDVDLSASRPPSPFAMGEGQGVRARAPVAKRRRDCAVSSASAPTAS